MSIELELPPSFFDTQPALRILRIDETWRYVTLMAKRHGIHPDNRRNHTVEGYAVNFVLQGQGIYEEDNGRVHVLAPGALFQRLPGRRHSTVFDPGSDYAELFLALDPATARQLLALGLIAPTEVMQMGSGTGVIDDFQALRRDLMRSETELPSPLALARVVEFLSALYERARRAGSGGLWDQIIRDACVLLEQDLDCRRNIMEIAAQLGVAYPSFRRRFREVVQLSPGAYRIQCRLDHARGLLLEKTVKEVSADLGYSDAFTFSTQFKQHFGQSPRRFQQEQGQR